jgi:membrane-associated HD superfamily phosphohydrolase
MLIIVLGILFLSLVTIFVGVDFLLYPMDRVTSRDSRFSTELGSFSIQQVIFAGIAIAISGYYYFEINKVPLLTNVKEGLGITLALSVITLSINFAFGAGDYSELAFRYFFYVYFFVPFPLGILLSKIKWDKNFTLFTMLLTSAYFFYSFENSAWKYASIETIILSPIFYYF